VPKPTDPQTEPLITLNRFAGIKNVVGEGRLAPEEFSSARNVDLDDVGQVRRRRGSTKVISGDWHSLYGSETAKLYGVRNKMLVAVKPNLTLTTIYAGVGAHPALGSQLEYVQVGSTIYFSSPFESGKFDEDTLVVSPWGSPTDVWQSPVLNPTADLPAIRGRLLGAPPRATSMTYWRGRIYLAQGKTVWATELYAYDLVDKTRGFYQFEADVTMLGAVSDGIYVGTATGLWFLSGTHAEGLKGNAVMDSAVIPGSRVYMPAELANPPQVDLGADTPLSIAILFMTANGYCAGQNSGQAFNLTESKVLFPDAVRAHALYRKQDGAHHYVAVLDSGGTPSANSRTSPYLDAELVRAGTWVDSNDQTAAFGDRVDITLIPAGH